jgi:two-component system capsular synthesis response regulator RcsB
MTIRVIAVDDHDAVIAGVKGLLEREPNIKIVGTAKGPTQLMDILTDLECDVLFTDLSMPRDGRPDGIQMIELIRRQYPRVAVVVLTMLTNPVTLRAALKCGVIGLCDKASVGEDLVEAARCAAGGRTFLSKCFSDVLEDAAATDETLSPHEAEVVRLFGEGLSVADIAVRLVRSKQTISRQKRDAMRKLGLDSDGQLIAYARSAGFSP